MAGLQKRFREKQYDFRSFGTHRKAEVDDSWKLLQSVADKVGVFWSGLGWFLSLAILCLSSESEEFLENLIVAWQILLTLSETWRMLVNPKDT